VLEVAPAPVADVGHAELLAEAPGASWVGTKDSKALAGQHLERVWPSLHHDAGGQLRLEGQRGLALRPALDRGEPWLLRPLVVADGPDEDALALHAVLAFPLHRLHPSQCEAVEVRVAVAAALGPELVHGRYMHLRGQTRPVDHERRQFAVLAHA